MLLTMTIVRCPDQTEPEIRTAASGKYAVGRGPNMDWRLPDHSRQISNCHFVLEFRGGAWWVTDLSTNGTFLNNELNPIPRGIARPLRSGDRLRFGDYEIDILLKDDQPAQHSRENDGQLDQSPYDNLSADFIPNNFDALLKEPFGPVPIQAPIPCDRDERPLASPELSRFDQDAQKPAIASRPVGMGTILWSLPNHMKVGRRERIEVRIGNAAVAIELLKSGLRGRGVPEIEFLEVAPLMRVALIADAADFSILNLNSTDQLLRADQVARWDFDVIPLRGGRRLLRVLVSVRMKVEGKDEITDFPSFEREVEVAVAPFRTVGHFYAKNWQWITGSVFIPIFVWASVASGILDWGSAHLHRLLK